MGTIRAFLALAVVFTHTSQSHVFTGGLVAVQIFFLISGFLMSYVLLNNPAYRNPLVFYRSRALRLYPMYLLIVVTSLIALVAFDNYAGTFLRLNFWQQAGMALSQFAMFGQDWMLLSVRSADASLMPQAWSLGCEVTFYAIAPFIVRRLRIIVAIFFLSLIVRIALFVNGYTQDPYVWRFFPSVIGMFMLGIISHQVVMPRWKNAGATTVCLGTAVLFAATVTWINWKIPALPALYLLVGLFMLLMPLAFRFQSETRLDQKIGELSYPIYIVHWLVIWLIGSRSDDFLRDWLAIGLSVVAAVALNRFVQKPFDSMREKTQFQRKGRDHGNSIPLASPTITQPTA